MQGGGQGVYHPSVPPQQAPLGFAQQVQNTFPLPNIQPHHQGNFGLL